LKKCRDFPYGRCHLTGSLFAEPFLITITE
jgi:hypothetical protein